jgi:chitinase
MKRTLTLIPLFLLLMFTANAQKTKKSNFKVVGYYSLQTAKTIDLKKVPFDQMTHINLYFLNPDTLGNIKQDFAALIPFITEAHKHGVKVLPSIAGGSRHTYYVDILENKRAMFINNLLLTVLNYDFDGIDVDIEGRDIDKNYENFVVGLAKVMKAHNKLTTAAIAVFYKDQLSDNALAQYDFVNVMSYDHSSARNPGPHSSYTHAVEDLDYFGTVRKIPKEKMVLGVPFYGYAYGTDPSVRSTSMTYGNIVKNYPGSELADDLKTTDGKTMYYNGIPLIKKKTELAKQKASGIMIWQIQGDDPGKLSLLKAINDVGYSKK